MMKPANNVSFPRQQRNRAPAVAKVAVNGILLLDKPVGLSSNAALQRVKRLFNARKAGHTGSLDPLATGMLPICFGEATKLSHCLLEADKTYQFVCQLGQRTTTGDAEGELLESQAVPVLSQTQVEQVLADFVGVTEQIPPMYSALKHQGKRLYELARQGKEVERPPRQVVIKQLSLLTLTPDRIECRVRCSKGTYVRVLAEDIATALGSCGHVIALRRETVAPFESGDMVELAQLEQLVEQRVQQCSDTLEDGSSQTLLDYILPVDAGLTGSSRLELDALHTKSICMGQAITLEQAQTMATGQVSLFGPDNQLIGLGEVLANGRVRLRRRVRSD